MNPLSPLLSLLLLPVAPAPVAGVGAALLAPERAPGAASAGPEVVSSFSRPPIGTTGALAGAGARRGAAAAARGPDRAGAGVSRAEAGPGTRDGSGAGLAHPVAAGRDARRSTAAQGAAAPSAPPAPPPASPQEVQAPPQFLPITARWCLGGPTLPPCIALEVPRGERQYALGLMRRPPLPPLRGMWFPYAPPAQVRFWMHQTPAPLDMLFVADGRVVSIEAAVPPCARLPCPSYGVEQPVEGVLELAAGEARRLGLAPGRVVQIEPVP
jgi:uncharacterized membrane protein (UPF0127 family)